MGIEVREARAGDGPALARIHDDMGAYYAELAPHHFQRPRIDGFAEELDALLGRENGEGLHLVAELDGEVVAALFAQMVRAAEGADREITPDSGQRRLRIEYVATAARHRRSGAGSRLVQAAEAWGREHEATVAETWTYQNSPLSMPFWTERMGFEQRSVNLRKAL